MPDHKFGGTALVFDQKFDMVLEVHIHGVFQGTCSDPEKLGVAIIGALTEFAEDMSSVMLVIPRPDAWRTSAAALIATAIGELGASGTVTEMTASISDESRKKIQDSRMKSRT